MLKELKDYTEYHFKDEEEYMQSIQYAGLSLQKLQHEAFIERLAEVNLDAVDEGQDDYLEELLEYLTGWLMNHILKTDKKKEGCFAFLFKDHSVRLIQGLPFGCQN